MDNPGGGIAGLNQVRIGGKGNAESVESKLGYLRDLGVTALWLSPIFKQRGHLDTFHGYGIQHFLDVDPRFGTRGPRRAGRGGYDRGMRIILDIIFNHSGFNWVYPRGLKEPPYKPFPDHYPFGSVAGPERRGNRDPRGRS